MLHPFMLAGMYSVALGKPQRHCVFDSPSVVCVLKALRCGFVHTA